MHHNSTLKPKLNNFLASTSDYEKTGVLSVDMVAACVSFYRKKNMPIKTLYLSGKYYGQFKDWVRRQCDKNKMEYDETEVEALMKFDGVNIEKGSGLMLKSMYWDFYEDKKELPN